MRNRVLVSLGIVAAVVAATVAQTPRTYRAPRTAWGDPDISGNYTNKYEQGTPFERPR